MKEVKFYFYKIEYELADSLTDFDFREYFKNPFEIKTHLFDIGDHKAFIDKKTDTMYSFQKFRKDFNPRIKDEVTGNTREINLKQTEYFIEESYFYIDFSNEIVIFQRNGIGYNATALEKYVLKLLKNKFKNDFFALKPIMSKDGIEKLLHHNVAKQIELKVAGPNLNLLGQIGLNVKEIRDLDYEALDSIEIKITSKRKTGIFNLSKLTDLLNLTENKSKYKKLKIKTSTSYEGTGDMVDLLDDLYVIVEKIKYKTGTKVVDQNDIMLKLLQIYENNISKILEIAKSGKSG